VTDIDNDVDDDGATAAVRSRLRAARITVSDDELEATVETYRFLQAGLRSLYDATGVRYAEPALVFRAAPTTVVWGD
jgi:hypothetical protein